MNTGGTELVSTWYLRSSQVHQTSSCIGIVTQSYSKTIKAERTKEEDIMLCARTVLSTVTNLSRPGVPSVDVNLEMFLLSTVRQVSDFLHSCSLVFSHSLLNY